MIKTTCAIVFAMLLMGTTNIAQAGDSSGFTIAKTKRRLQQMKESYHANLREGHAKLRKDRRCDGLREGNNIKFTNSSGMMIFGDVEKSNEGCFKAKVMITSIKDKDGNRLKETLYRDRELSPGDMAWIHTKDMK